ncbi:MAG: class I mannose-6-phosphate isomerase [Clostridiales bacterium]|nr:class I mannose-6-phosphate isomerase [Clostridiales bacterium]
MYYPIKFKPLYKDNIWGGRNLEKLNKELPKGITGESWEIAAHPDGMGIISNGQFKDMTLEHLVNKYGRDIIGTKLPEKDLLKFPLLIKLIDANNDLSIQVHPNDIYANEYENGEYGKNEMWYVVDCKPGAKLVYDIKKGITKDDFRKAVLDDTIEDTLNFINVKPGDCFNIPAGLVHAIGTGLVICEVQQNSNTTYRVYDYKREDANGNRRQLHINKALDVIDFSHNYKSEKSPGLIIKNEQVTKKYIIANKYFSVEHIDVNGQYIENTLEERFHTYTILTGNGSIGSENVKMGQSLLIPAKLGLYKLSGQFTAIKAYVPNIEKDVIKPLLTAGYSLEKIKQKIIG